MISADLFLLTFVTQPMHTQKILRSEKQK